MEKIIRYSVLLLVLIGIASFDAWSKLKTVAVPDENGRWSARIQTPAAGGPYEVVITDGEKVTLRNILVGEVWFCSGQSNMEMPMQGFRGQPVEGAADAVISAKPEKPIRMCTVKRLASLAPVDKCEGSWKENTPEAVASTSATAYWFALKMQEILNVPIGILIPHSGMATTMDGGEFGCIHPRKKKEVGNRLAYLALVGNYGFKGINPIAPAYESANFEDGKAIVTMKINDRGLSPWGRDVIGFELAGSDKVFHPATGQVKDAKTIVVVSPEVPEPVAVRYCFRNWSEGNLCNNWGIPAGPFRSDDWNIKR